MNDTFEYNGIWWLPDKPEKQISGTLKFNKNEGAILDLIGSFKDLREINTMLEPEIILGKSSNGKYITLNKCLETKCQLNMPGLLNSTFFANVVFVGAHFNKEEEIKFSKLYVYYSHLDEWVNISGFDIDRESLPKREIIIKYKQPESILIANVNDLKIFIDFLFKGPTFSIVQKEVHINQKTCIKIELNAEKSFEECLKIIYHIQNFLTLGVSEIVSPMEVKGISEGNNTNSNNKSYNPLVEIYYLLISKPDILKTLLPMDMLFSFRDIKERTDSFFMNWFSKAEILEPIYNLYFSTLYLPNLYSEYKFRSYIEAIESYHRRTMNNTELPEDRHLERLNVILNVVPSNYEEWLKNKLTYSNEPSLRKRLKELISKYSEITNLFIPNYDSFIHKVVSTRHYLTHYDESLKRSALTGKSLFDTTQMLKILIELLLLVELGFKSDEIKNLFLNNRKYKYIIEHSPLQNIKKTSN